MVERVNGRRCADLVRYMDPRSFEINKIDTKSIAIFANRLTPVVKGGDDKREAVDDWSNIKTLFVLFLFNSDNTPGCHSGQPSIKRADRLVTA